MSDDKNTKKVPESVKVLQECAELQMRKSADYQNPLSTVKQADYYFRGLTTILEEVDKKRLRLKSLLEQLEHDPAATPKNESIEDTLKDMINYTSFGVSWCRKGIDGQDVEADLFNRKKR